MKAMPRRGDRGGGWSFLLHPLPFLLAACSGAGSLDEAGLARAIEADVQRIAAQESLWPGFEPLSIPLAIYTGQATWLFRHPSPPDGFLQVADSDPLGWRWEGRHPAATSNTSADIGGVVTATLLADGPRGREASDALAAVALHEAFHVFQRSRHPGWVGNEADLLLYPFEDAALLTRRRLETEALRRALADREEAACWAHRALRFRHERFAMADSAYAVYERATELNEGVATWIQLRAAGASTVEFPPDGFAATELRLRAYTVGPALGLLLDRFDPGWRDSLETDDHQSLDGLLEASLPAAAVCDGEFPVADRSRIEQRAASDAEAVVAARTARETAFDQGPGWRVVVETAPGAPLWPQGFDPLNVERVDRGMLHTRFVQLGNEAGELTMVDGEGADLAAITEAAGPHPLFNGVRRVVIAGLAQRPAASRDTDRVTVTAPGLSLTLRGAEVEEGDSVLTIRLGP